MAAPADRPLRICEFYSGIGGWRYALDRATAQTTDVMLAVDASTTCNAIYEHNFGQRPSQKRVETLTAEDVGGADGWLLSPPCQPYTRQHAMTDTEDPRAASLLHLCELLEAAPPSFICLANVVGFEMSRSRDRWHDALRRAGFSRPKCWHLTPTALGVPHERPRYYESAVRRGGDWASPAPLNEWPGLPEAPPMRPIAEFLEAPYALDQGADASTLIEPYRIPAKVLARDAAWCFDVVDAVDAVPTACFTRSYGRFNRGTGSVLRVRTTRHDPDLASLGFSRTAPEARPFGDTWRAALQLRYFAPKEVANLLGFPPAFRFPASTSLKGRWAAAGNSLHVDAAAAVLRVALEDLGGPRG